VISGFCREVEEIYALLGCYAAYNDNSLLDFLTLEDGSDRLSRNVGKQLPLYAA